MTINHSPLAELPLAELLQVAEQMRRALKHIDRKLEAGLGVYTTLDAIVPIVKDVLRRIA